MTRTLAMSLLISGLLACPKVTNPQRTVPAPSSETASDTSAKSASLMRRLAEAADGYRDGKPHWVAIDRNGQEGHHMVLGVFDTYEQAALGAKRAGSEYQVFGPFVTVDDPPDSSSSGEDVEYVIVRQKDGVEKRFGADSVDALFWSLAAFDKFIAPYLASVDGVRYAAEQRELYRRNRSPLRHSTVVAHKAGSF